MKPSTKGDFMFKILSLIAIFFASTQVFAAPLTPSTIIGRYKVNANVAFKKVDVNFHVIDTRTFEIERVMDDGSPSETCNGAYTMPSAMYWAPDVLVYSQYFKGTFTCPSNRSRNVDFNIYFGDTTTEDLVKGTTVIVTTSMAPGMRVKARVKKL
jgi:hypothetical protein